MFRLKFLLAACLGTMVYVALSIFLGPEGFAAQSKLEKERQFLQQNVQKIQQINESLSVDYTSLRVDADVIAGYAKTLGYIYDGERILKINGIQNTVPFNTDVGKAIQIKEIRGIPEWLCKMCGFVVFLFFLLLFFLDTVRTELHNRKIQVLSQRAMHENIQI